MHNTSTRSRCECTENQTVYCTTELCLSVNKLKKDTKKNREGKMLVYRGQCLCSVHSVNC